MKRYPPPCVPGDETRSRRAAKSGYVPPVFLTDDVLDGDAPDCKRPAPPSGPFLHELAGMGEARKWGEAVAQDIKDYLAGRLEWSEIDAGCVLHGPPGTGKTTFARALAATCRLPLIESSFGDWQTAKGGHLGDMMAEMSNAFDEARRFAPCIFFIDELDSLPARSGGGSANDSYWNAGVNHLLKRLDTIAEMKGVVIVTACNYPHLLDPALVRAGRLGRKLAVSLPTLQDLPQILRFHLKEHADGMGDLSHEAMYCLGMTGADVAQLAKDVRRMARRAGRRPRPRDIRECIEASSPTLSREELRRVAVHESGHAVAAYRLALCEDVRACILAKDGSAGQMIASGSKGRPLTAEFVGIQLAVLLAGRAAEEIMLGSVSAGAGGGVQSDLAQATRLAYDAVAKLGLSGNPLDLIWHEHLDANTRLLGNVAAGAKALLTEAYERARQLIKTEHALVHVVACDLETHRTISHTQIAELDSSYLVQKARQPFEK